MNRPRRWLQRNDSRLQAVLKLVKNKFGVVRRQEGLDLLQVTVLTVLSQNTTDVNARQAYIGLLEEFSNSSEEDYEELQTTDIRVVDLAFELGRPDWERLAASSAERLAEAIAPAGLQQAKSRTILALLKKMDQLAENFSDLQEIFEEFSHRQALELLTSVDGIGLKTAGVVLMETTRADICPVDTHINRICRRLRLVSYQGPSRDKLFWELQPLIPAGEAYQLHHGLLSFGRRICTARNPSCSSCPAARICWDLRVDRGGEDLQLKFV